MADRTQFRRKENTKPAAHSGTLPALVAKPAFWQSHLADQISPEKEQKEQLLNRLSFIFAGKNATALRQTLGDVWSLYSNFIHHSFAIHRMVTLKDRIVGSHCQCQTFQYPVSIFISESPSPHQTRSVSMQRGGRFLVRETKQRPSGMRWGGIRSRWCFFPGVWLANWREESPRRGRYDFEGN
jgi:hypothetical protein